MSADEFEIDVPDGVPITFDEFTLGPREIICPLCWTAHAGECV